MGKKKLDETKADDREPAWVQPWCRDNLDELEEYRGFVVILHEEHGIVSAARSMSELWGHARFLNKKLLPHIAYVHTSDVLPPLNDKREDDDELGPVPEDFAVPEKTEPPVPLSPPIDLFDNNVVLDGSQPPPFPSPHPQPPFMPRPSADRGNIRVDGVARGPRSGIRYD
jgi:hypothetical protein